MARKPQRSAKRAPKSAPALPPPGGTDRDNIIAAFMALLAEKRFDQIGFGDISARANVSLATARTEFGSTLAILAAHMKELDRKVLAGGEGDMADEPPRERLFDVLMRRLDAMRPYRDGLREISHRVLVLYLGRVVETATREQIYQAPRHPYTRALLSAAPIPDPAIERARQRVKLSGEPPSPMDPRAALRFLPSRLPSDLGAPFAAPELKEVAPGHFVAEFDPPEA